MDIACEPQLNIAILVISGIWKETILDKRDETRMKKGVCKVRTNYCSRKLVKLEKTGHTVHQYILDYRGMRRALGI